MSSVIDIAEYITLDINNSFHTTLASDIKFGITESGTNV